MRAEVGDRLHVHGAVVGRSDQTSEIIEVRGPDGAGPYLVRRVDGHEALVFPGADASVEHRASGAAMTSRQSPKLAADMGRASAAALSHPGTQLTPPPGGDDRSVLHAATARRVPSTGKWSVRPAMGARVSPTQTVPSQPFDDPCNYLG